MDPNKTGDFICGKSGILCQWKKEGFFVTQLDGKQLFGKIIILYFNSFLVNFPTTTKFKVDRFKCKKCKP